MKIHVVRDRAGRIVATFEPAIGCSGAILTPVLEEGERVEALEVPSDYKDDLYALYAGRYG